MSNYSSRNQPTSNRQLLITLGIVAGFIALIIWGLFLLVGQLVWWIPPSVERQLGRVVLPQFERVAKPSDAQDRLNQLLDNLEGAMSVEAQRDRNYRVLYVPEQTVNAIALPGDAIIIYQGLLQKMQSENELMMVLGHELGHFVNRDHLRGIGRTIVLKTILAAVVGDASWLQALLANAAYSLTQAQFSQGQERQADEYGLTLLVSNYGHAAGATDFFARLAKESNSNLAFLSTHPAPGKRVEILKDLIEERDYPIGERSPLPPELQISDLKGTR